MSNLCNPLDRVTVAVDRRGAAAVVSARHLQQLGARLVGLEASADIAIRCGSTGIPARVDERAFLPVGPKVTVVVEASPAHTDAFRCAQAGLGVLPLKPPRKVPFAVSTVLGARWITVAALAGWFRFLRGGTTTRTTVDLAQVAVHANTLSALFAVRPPPVWNTLQWAGSPFVGLYRCADGAHLFVHLGQPAHVQLLLGWLENTGDVQALIALQNLLTPDVASQPLEVPSVRRARRIRRCLEALFIQRTAAEWQAVLLPEGLSVNACQDVETFRHSDAAASLFVDEERTELRLPFSLKRGAEAADAELAAVDVQQNGPLAGIRVADVSQVIAGPFAAQVLARFGATVCRVHNPRLDAPWVEPFHLAFNSNKTVRALDLEAQPGAASNFLRGCDVVLHNRPAGCPIAHPAPVQASVSAFGTEGPFAGFRGWEQTAQALCGMQDQWGTDKRSASCSMEGEGPPEPPNDQAPLAKPLPLQPKQKDGAPELFPAAINDLGTGLAAAMGVLVGLIAVHRERRSVVVDASLVATATEYALSTASNPERFENWVRARDGWVFVSGPLKLWTQRVGSVDAFRKQRVAAWQSALGAEFQMHKKAGIAASVASLLRRVEVDGVGNVSLLDMPLRGEAVVPLTTPEPIHPRKTAGWWRRMRWVFVQGKWAVYSALEARRVSLANGAQKNVESRTQRASQTNAPNRPLS